MTKTRIDLLKDTERRYQGPIRIHFLYYSLGATLVAGLLLASAFKIFRYIMLGREIESRRQSWTSAEPRYRRMKETEAAGRAIGGLFAELEGWRSARVAWDRELLNLQRRIPPTAQLTRVDMRDDWLPLRPAQAGKPFPDPSRQIRVVFNGRVYGDKGESVASQIVNQLRPAHQGTNVFRSVELVSTRMESLSGDPTLAFDIEAHGEERPVK